MKHTNVFKFVLLKSRWLGGRRMRFIAAIACSLCLCWGLSAVYQPTLLRTSSPPVVATVEVDRGDVAQVVIENGSIEGSDDDVVRCRVESFWDCRSLQWPEIMRAHRPR